MNWKVIIKYALLLWLALFSVGFFEGLLITPPTDSKVIFWHFAVSNLISFLLGTFVFSLVYVRQSQSPFLHTGLVLLLASVISLIFNQAISILLPEISYPMILAVIDWLVFFASFMSGTLIGHIVRWRSKRNITCV